jgi:hypothetical protein
MKTNKKDKLLWKISTRNLFSIITISTVLLLSTAANAATVVYEDMGFIKGYGGTTSKFAIDKAGQYEVSLIDFKYPTNFDSLSVQITQGNPSPLSEIGRWDAGTNIFNASAPGVYYANIVGNMGANSYDLGLYGLQITASVVPIPPSFILLISGVVVLAAFGNGGRRLSAQRDVEAKHNLELATVL